MFKQSKTIPIQWAKGTFNSGLLATEAGTFGRVVGDGFLSYVSFIGFNDYLLNGIFVPIFILGLALIPVVIVNGVGPLFLSKLTLYIILLT